MTHREIVRRHLQDHKQITSWEAFTEYGITRLSAVIYDLRHKEGYGITGEYHPFTNRYGTKSQYMIYKLEDTPAAVSSRLSWEKQETGYEQAHF